MQTDDAKLILAEIAIKIGRLGLDMAKIIERMNKDNNSLWKRITGIAGAVVAAVVVVFVTTAEDT